MLTAEKVSPALLLYGAMLLVVSMAVLVSPLVAMAMCLVALGIWVLVERPMAIVALAVVVIFSHAADIATDHPEKSLAASPLMSLPRWVQVLPLKAYTRTCPAPLPPPPLKRAPMATVAPSADMATEYPDPSLAASPLMTPPCWVQVLPLHL